MKKNYEDIPLSQSNVSLKLADIQKRCSDLIDDTDELGGLSLEEPVVAPDINNPYKRGAIPFFSSFVASALKSGSRIGRCSQCRCNAALDAAPVILQFLQAIASFIRQRIIDACPSANGLALRLQRAATLKAVQHRVNDTLPQRNGLIGHVLN